MDKWTVTAEMFGFSLVESNKIHNKQERWTLNVQERKLKKYIYWIFLVKSNQNSQHTRTLGFKCPSKS